MNIICMQTCMYVSHIHTRPHGAEQRGVGSLNLACYMLCTHVDAYDALQGFSPSGSCSRGPVQCYSQEAARRFLGALNTSMTRLPLSPGQQGAHRKGLSLVCCTLASTALEPTLICTAVAAALPVRQCAERGGKGRTVSHSWYGGGCARCEVRWKHACTALVGSVKYAVLQVALTVRSLR